MSKGNIILIIVLMSIASLGLMGFQYYWVKNAIRINEERFEQLIHQALSGTVEQLEKGETSDVLLSKLIQDPALQQSLFQKIEPIEVKIGKQKNYTRKSLTDTLLLNQMPQVSPTFRRMLQSRGLDMSVLEELENFFTYMTPEVASSIFTPDEMEILLQEKEKQFQYLNKNQGFQLKKSAVNSSEREQSPELNISPDALEKIKKTNLKIELMNQAWDELAAGQKAILERLDTIMVRKLVKNHLLELGIIENFELGIIKDNGAVMPLGFVSDPLLLVSQGAHAKLFPNDIIGKDNFLYLYFPDKNYHVIRQVWLPISSSLVFIGVIIFCFIYAIKVIIRQKALSDIKNDFINNMTHEFKTPLATVSLAVEALQDPELSTQDKFRIRYLGIIRDENKRLVSQVEKVLQAAALDKKDFRLKIESLNLSELLENNVDQMSLLLEKRAGKISLVNKLTDPIIEGDAFHMTHIINNLLDNANKYSPEKPVITIEAKNSGNQVVISVKDQGMGMSKEAHRKIFDKFYRVHTGNLHDVKGFGLGLSYVKTMLEAHKGTIQVQSELGKGSTFTIYLPKNQHE
jgi:two-component system phosphate regulon sensor histidine kinase PhoR